MRIAEVINPLHFRVVGFHYFLCVLKVNIASSYFLSAGELIGSKEESGLGCFCFCILKCVKDIKPPKDTKKPMMPMTVIGMLK